MPLKITPIVFASLLLALTACGENDASYNNTYDRTPYDRQDMYVDPNQNNIEEPPTRGEVYDEVIENDVIDTAVENTSTFSIDVDTASYTLMRRDIEDGRLPDPKSVRPEEYINYFDYQDPQPVDEHPFSINMEVAPSYFADEGTKHLMRVNIQGKTLAADEVPPSNLIFLIDVSGSMSGRYKLPLVKQSLTSLLDKLRPEDTVGIVVYAGADRVVLNPTPVSQRQTIENAINNLQNGGSTNGEAGIVKAYKLAEGAKQEGGNNRVILMTDGDFNVGKTGESLFQLIEDYRQKHISLTCVGYGMGNYNDSTMENLSNRGNGNYFYVDSLQEAQRIFGKEVISTLHDIASDVKIQVEFDQTTVKSYRLIGYENRVLDNKDFDDDTKDAGEIGSGHRVTAFYEIELAPESDRTALLSRVNVRYKPTFGASSILMQRAIKVANVKETFDEASDALRFGAAVTEYAEILRKSKYSKGARFMELISIAQGAAIAPDEKQKEFFDLLEKARLLWQK